MKRQKVNTVVKDVTPFRLERDIMLESATMGTVNDSIDMVKRGTRGG